MSHLIPSGACHWIATCKVSLPVVCVAIQTLQCIGTGKHCSLPPIKAFRGIPASEGTHCGRKVLWCYESHKSSSSIPHLKGCSPAPLPILLLVSASTPRTSSFTCTTMSPRKLSPAHLMAHNHIILNMSNTELTTPTFMPPASPLCQLLPLYFQL